MIDFESAYVSLQKAKGSDVIHSTLMDGKNSVMVPTELWQQCDISSSYPPSRLLIIVKWIGKILTSTYLSQPWTLAILPILLGIILGYILATVTTNNPLKNKKRYSRQPLSKNPFHVSILDDDDKDQEDTDAVLYQPSPEEEEKNQVIRNTLSLTRNTKNVEKKQIGGCRHLAVIMDGNRRYGKQKYGDATKGHNDGSRRLIEFISWCMLTEIQELTVYAFSTENWNRSPREVQALMDLLYHYIDELRTKAIERGIQINVLSTDTSKIPKHVVRKIQRMIRETRNNRNFVLNICLSYGGRGEIVQACQRLTQTVLDGELCIDDINEDSLSQQLSTSSDPDVILRTSGEFRLSNFLLWQSAYSEFFFLNKPWPDITKEDLQQVLTQYSQNRQRRYGK